ncbi:hypothetical protein Tco_0367443 [Tanacetum coccineum]
MITSMQKYLQKNSQEHKAPRLKTSQEGSTIEFDHPLGEIVSRVFSKVRCSPINNSRKTKSRVYWYLKTEALATTAKGNFWQLDLPKTEYLDAYDSNCDDISSTKAVLMENLSSCDPEVLSKIHSDSDTIPYSQYLQESQDAVIQDTNSSAPNDLLVLSLVEQITDHIDHLDRGKSEQINDIDEIETINIELEHSVAKLLSKNENLRKEREHLKSSYKDQFDSIRKTRVQSKEHCDSLIAQINAKSVENSDLNAQLQEKVFAITTLKNELRKL